jgi:hypothetical protein
MPVDPAPRLRQTSDQEPSGISVRDMGLTRLRQGTIMTAVVGELADLQPNVPGEGVTGESCHRLQPCQTVASTVPDRRNEVHSRAECPVRIS